MLRCFVKNKARGDQNGRGWGENEGGDLPKARATRFTLSTGPAAGHSLPDAGDSGKVKVLALTML